MKVRRIEATVTEADGARWRVAVDAVPEGADLTLTPTYVDPEPVEVEVAGMPGLLMPPSVLGHRWTGEVDGAASWEWVRLGAVAGADGLPGGGGHQETDGGSGDGTEALSGSEHRQVGAVPGVPGCSCGAVVPLGVALSRWWDRHLAEVGGAVDTVRVPLSALRALVAAFTEARGYWSSDYATTDEDENAHDAETDRLVAALGVEGL